MPSNHLFRRCLPFLAAAWVALAQAAPAQEITARQTPLSAWLDLRPAPPGAPPQTTPAWIEAFDFIPAVLGANLSAPNAVSMADRTGQGIDRSRSLFRIRLQKPAAAVSDLQARILFDDLPDGPKPFLSVWNELGTELMRSKELGQGLGLPSSETLTVPMDGVDYLEISATGDGSQVRGVFLSWLEKARVLQPADFPSREAVRQPFHISGNNRRRKEDAYLYGVVFASLQGKQPSVLRPGTDPAATFEFELERRPLLAVIGCEVLGATLRAAPTVRVNGRWLGPVEVFLPDLADPAFRGEQKEAASQMDFRYTGWLQAQIVVPGEMLHAGLNSLVVALSEGSESVAIRSLEIQLKYNWEKLDYILTPAPLPLPVNP